MNAKGISSRRHERHLITGGTMNRRGFLAGAGALALAAPAATLMLDAAETPAAGATLQEVRLGQLVSYTGDLANYGLRCKRGAQMRIDEINQSGGVAGKFRLKYVPYDDESKVEIASAVAQKLVGDRIQMFLSTTASTFDIAINPVIKRGRVLMLVWGNTNPKITIENPYAFRDVYTALTQGYVDAWFMAEKLGQKKIATITDNSNVGNSSTTDRVVEVFTKKYRGAISAKESFQEGDKDFRAQLTRIKATGAECLYIAGFSAETALVAKQCLDVGYKPKYLVGNDSWDDPNMIKLAGKELQQDFQSYFTTALAADDPDPIFQNWAKKFKAKYPGETPSTVEAQGYDAVQIGAWALTKAGKYNGDAMRQALETLVNRPPQDGIKGLIMNPKGLTFNSTHDPIMAITVVQIKNDKFSYVAKINPGTDGTRSYS